MSVLRADSLLMAPLRVWIPRMWAPNQHVVFQTRELTEPPPDLQFKLPAAVLDAYRENSNTVLRIPRQIKTLRNGQTIWVFPYVVRGAENLIDPPPQPVPATPKAAAAAVAANPLDQQPISNSSARRRARETAESFRGQQVTQTEVGTIIRNYQTGEMHIRGTNSSLDITIPMSPNPASTPVFRDWESTVPPASSSTTHDQQPEGQQQEQASPTSSSTMNEQQPTGQQQEWARTQEEEADRVREPLQGDEKEKESRGSKRTRGATPTGAE